MADLCTLAEVKDRHRIKPGETRWDALITEWIEPAGVQVEQHCGGRQFAKDAAPSTRVFVSAGGPDIAIDDLSAPPTIVTVHDQAGALIADVTTDTVTEPRNLTPGGWRSIRALRFRTATVPAGCEIHVTGVWGCPRVPPHVKEAVIETIRDWLRASLATTDQAPDSDAAAVAPSRGLPTRARVLLDTEYDWRVPS